MGSLDKYTRKSRFCDYRDFLLGRVMKSQGQVMGNSRNHYHISLSPSPRQMFVAGVSQGIGQGGQNIFVKYLGDTPKNCYLDPEISQCQHGSLSTFGREISIVTCSCLQGMDMLLVHKEQCL